MRLRFLSLVSVIGLFALATSTGQAASPRGYHALEHFGGRGSTTTASFRAGVVMARWNWHCAATPRQFSLFLHSSILPRGRMQLDDRRLAAGKGGQGIAITTRGIQFFAVPGPKPVLKTGRPATFSFEVQSGSQCNWQVSVSGS